MTAILYLHGKGGSPAECEHYRPLFPGCTVTGLDYRGATPWEAGPEIHRSAGALKQAHESVLLIANSIGAYFSLHGALDGLIDRAYFISPVTDMEGMILGLMRAAGVTEAELKARGVIPTDFGEDLRWDYLNYVRSHPVRWTVPTQILYGSGDTLVPEATVRRFAKEHRAELTILEGGEHWFHTDEQMAFLDRWILNCEIER